MLFSIFRKIRDRRHKINMQKIRNIPSLETIFAKPPLKPRRIFRRSYLKKRYFWYPKKRKQ